MLDTISIAGDELNDLNDTAIPTTVATCLHKRSIRNSRKLVLLDPVIPRAAADFTRLNSTSQAFMQVVAAVSKETGRRVALKVVFLDNPGLQQQHADVLQAEVTIMEKLNDPKHPNIVSFENIIHDPIRKQLVIAEEILLGGTLTDELLHGSNCNNDRLVAHIFKQVRPRSLPLFVLYVL